MKKVVIMCASMLMAAMVFMLGACSTSSSKSYRFDVETGDKIKVELDTSSGLSLSQKDGRFTVSQDDEKLLEGMFIHEDGYKSYLAIKGEQGMKVLENSQKDGNSYYMYEVEGETGTEDNFVMWIQDSNTGMLMASLAGEEKAKDAFEKLTVVQE